MITTKPSTASHVSNAIQTALGRIAPLWPLQSFVAVNPFLGYTDMPFELACEKLGQATGELPLLPRSQYCKAFESGEIQPDHLEQVADDLWSVEQLIEFIRDPEAEMGCSTIPTIADLLDRSRPRAHWVAFIVDEISKWCSVHFDKNQTTWNSPWRDFSLYEAWREAALLDRNPEAFGLSDFRKFVAELPDSAEETIAWCVDYLPIPSSIDLADFLQRHLMTISGWAGYAQYLAREDRMQGQDNPVLRDLLAIRLAYDAALYSAFDSRIALRDAAMSWQGNAGEAAAQALSRWQRAYEMSYQYRLSMQLTAAEPPSLPERPSSQVVFCIDVRSEIFRRHLEASASGCQTIGFAGFFGFPVAYRDAGTESATARCPVLLSPIATTAASGSVLEKQSRRARNVFGGAWKALQNSAASCFTFVETAGIFFGPRMGLRGDSSCGCGHDALPVLEETNADNLELKVTLALGALKNMGLSNFARLVLICGHGSQSANNPYASALDCGACGGHAGDVNARLAAATLNDPDVRQSLAAKGVVLPEDTVFLAGIHNTMIDEVTIFDLEGLPSSHQSDLSDLRGALDQAGRLCSRERAKRLGLDRLAQEKIPLRLADRSGDISQTRPEWGLANNAAFVAAPRWRTAGLKLDGRVFLHDYDTTRDVDSSVLTLILCAPVVVASWINLQYYASRVNPGVYGSGNKTLHNVTGGLGVLEGNGGDLRVGLPMQSIHDGTRFVHEPRRLSVFVEAPMACIDAVLAAQPGVCDLFRNTWIHLFALDAGGMFRWSPTRWKTT